MQGRPGSQDQLLYGVELPVSILTSHGAGQWDKGINTLPKSFNQGPQFPGLSGGTTQRHAFWVPEFPQWNEVPATCMVGKVARSSQAKRTSPGVAEGVSSEQKHRTEAGRASPRMREWGSLR